MTRSAPLGVFADLTTPVAAETFLADSWGRRAVLLRDPARRLDRYFGWEALNAVLNAGDLTYPGTVVSREDRLVDITEYTSGADSRIDPAAMMRLVREGASFSVRGADALWPPLRALRTGLYDALHEAVHTNVYFSPANTQGFRCHYDLHEVFVLQIDGRKHWKVFDPTTQSPVEPWQAEDVPGPEVRPYLECTLQPGDVLYVPRGHWHYAVAQDTHSLHITAGIKTRKGDELLDWLGRELRSSEVWRRNVPIMGRASADGELPSTPAIREWVDEMRDMLLERLRDPDLWHRFLEDLFTRTSPVPEVRVPEDASSERPPIEQLTFRAPAVSATSFSRIPTERRFSKSEAPRWSSKAWIPRCWRENLAAPAVTLRDLEEWAPRMSRAEHADLLQSLADAGLLMASPL